MGNTGAIDIINGINGELLVCFAHVTPHISSHVSPHESLHIAPQHESPRIKIVPHVSSHVIHQQNKTTSTEHSSRRFHGHKENNYASGLIIGAIVLSSCLIGLLLGFLLSD